MYPYIMFDNISILSDDCLPFVETCESLFCYILFFRDSVEDPLDDTGTVQQQLDQVTQLSQKFTTLY